MDFNSNWKFVLEDVNTAHLMDCDETSYETITLPHDYSILQAYNQEEGDGCTGYQMGGIAWYRKEFISDSETIQGQVYLYFDGIYNRSSIYFNEQFIKFHPYGYSPCLLDVTNYVNEGKNVVAVRVDHSRIADSRWYTGSGIYRKAELIVLPRCHIPPFAVKITTENVSKDSAEVIINTDIVNATPTTRLTLNITDPSGKLVVKELSGTSVSYTVENPVLWDVYQGNLYTVELCLEKNGVVIQRKTEKFGIRSFYFDVDKGFFLNDRNTLIKGVCLHHDAGLVGAAVPGDVWKRRLSSLKDCGCNAIRTAHNPFSADFLQICDEMGFLVQEEFYDEWDNPKDKRLNMHERRVDYITRGHHEFFQEYAEADLKAVIHRDFNHPSIIQWSIGNEIEWTYRKYPLATGYFDANAGGNYFWSRPPFSQDKIKENISKLPKEKYEMGETAKKLSKWTKEVDSSRPVVANLILPSASYEAGYTDALDVVGFSYRQVMYDYCHENYPDKPIMGTENLGQWHEWKQVLEKDHISGIFLWTGIDYMGESGNADVWPRKATASGLLDTACFPKPSYDFFSTLWKEEANVFLYTQTLQNSLYTIEDGALVEKEGKPWQKRLWQWHPMNKHWNYEAEESIVVEVYSNCEEVILYLNDREISTEKLENFPDHIYKWCIPYEKGKLKAIGKGAECILQSSGEAVKVALTCDKNTLSLDADSVVHITAQLLDENNIPVTHMDTEIEFSIEGACRVYGVDNGSPDFVGDHSSMKIMTHKGKALLILGGSEQGKMTVNTKTLPSNEVSISTVEKL